MIAKENHDTAGSSEPVDDNGLITLDRRHLSVLWLIGEFGIRTSEYSLQENLRVPGRARTGLLGVLDFVHGSPLTQEEAMQSIRNAYKGSSSNQIQN